MIKNIYKFKSQLVRAHEGVGQITFARVIDQNIDDSALLFLDYVTIPQGSSIGPHNHKDLEEVYILLFGDGTMLLGGTEHRVGPGDVIKIPVGTNHELRNNQDSQIQLIVCAVKTKANLKG